MSEKAELIAPIPFSPQRAIKLLAAVVAYFAIAYGFGPWTDCPIRVSAPSLSWWRPSSSG